MLAVALPLAFMGCNPTPEADASINMNLTVPGQLAVDRYNIRLENLNGTEVYQRDGAISQGIGSETFDRVPAGTYRVDALVYDNAAGEVRAIGSMNSVDVVNGGETAVNIQAESLQIEFDYLLFAGNNELQLTFPNSEPSFTSPFFETETLQLGKPLGGSIHYAPAPFEGEGQFTADLVTQATNTTLVAYLSQLDDPAFGGAASVYARVRIPLLAKWPDDLVYASPIAGEPPIEYELGGDVTITVQQQDTTAGQ